MIEIYQTNKFSEWTSDETEDYKVMAANIFFHGHEPEKYENESFIEDGTYKKNGLKSNSLKSKLESLSTDHGTQSLLDLGTGKGFILDLAKPYFENIVGVDICYPLLERASKKGHNVAIAEATRLPFENNRFNVVTSYAVLHHLSCLKPVICEVSRVLKSGGVFFSDFDPNEIAHKKSKFFIFFRDTAFKMMMFLRVLPKIRYYNDTYKELSDLAEYGWSHLEVFNHEKLRQLFSQYGFKDIIINTHNNEIGDSIFSNSFYFWMRRRIRWFLSGSWKNFFLPKEMVSEYISIKAIKD